MAEIRFLYHKRLDGSLDSICMRCFGTVAMGRSEAELEKPNAQHICEESVLTQRAGDQSRRRIDTTPAVDSRRRI
jgi:hypothetical protein